MTSTSHVIHGGHLYYSMPAAARLYGTTTLKLKEIIAAEGVECRNFRINGRMWVNASELESYFKARREKP